ncbi:phosphoglycerate mutase family protein [Sphingomonas sp. S17]|uniref:Histidine phosphatase family protein n=2 Tax=Sphingomonas paucimobilis TaxID=13689 RepID=A0A411LL94_SPHPI|nr:MULTISPECIES: histidine phosphatase family protein [Sphingomonas]EGI54776.1 phosphoglycerate mutase family protein [Sphingomonas sp. S17]MBQ1481847.1 histidine phosphatase family protein [Sphingomonas sp.]MCM3680137.1 histidine phosphatase family protein [Sphingomonas paucimobilis]NNG56285.1 histidine phosphatase family protein [Sphingomonas paucimobilis]QBE93124.1 histidine phosphatase family protein [Sphingomonas paucimobilis]
MPPAAKALPPRKGRDFIARHGETVFNRIGRIQGDQADLHTPLTRRGFAQAEAIGTALRDRLGESPVLTLWSSPTGRALQTLAVIAEHLSLDWHGTRQDRRLIELGFGSWGGETLADLATRHGPVVHPHGMAVGAPDGETYPAMAARLKAWLAETHDHEGDRLILMHGLSSRVLRGLMLGLSDDPHCGVPVAERLPQGSIVMIADGIESLLHRGMGAAAA